MSEPAPTIEPDRDTCGILICQDLIFTSKITGTARALDRVVRVAGNTTTFLDLIRTNHVPVLFLDLAAGALAGQEAIAFYRQHLGTATPFVAFGSHVHGDLLTAAREAGCDLVMPRSQFSSQVPALIQRFLGAATGAEPPK